MPPASPESPTAARDTLGPTMRKILQPYFCSQTEVVITWFRAIELPSAIVFVIHGSFTLSQQAREQQDCALEHLNT